MDTDIETIQASDLSQETGRSLHREADDLIRAIYEKQVSWSALRRAYELKLRAAYACVAEDPEAQGVWVRILARLGTVARELGVEPVVAHLGPCPGNTYLDALLHLTLRAGEWLRPLDEWVPVPDTAPRALVGDLARHLLACYDVPEFMDAAWFEGFCPEGCRHRDWFVHIGTGGNVRTACEPVHLTKRAAHHFLQAPASSSIVGAVRYGQTLGFGGDARLASALTDTKLGAILPDEPFWEGVIHFFVNNAGENNSRIGSIVDYIWQERFGGGPVPQPGQRFSPDDAPAPDFSMKGRTHAALWRRVEEWHGQLARDAHRPRHTWEPMGIEPLRLEERDQFGSLNLWTINELLSSQALMDEGREQHHCVFSYAPACVRGTTAIFSMRVRSHGEGRLRRVVTIEVDRERRAIVQVRGKCNKTVGSFGGKGRMLVAGEVLRRWAHQSHLTVRCAL
jgi:hypothetical protein